MIRVEHVSFTYPAVTVPAVKAVDLTLAPGGLTYVTGRLGAGASTLLMLLTGLAPRLTGGSREGQVRVFDLDPASAAGAARLRGRWGLLLPTPWTQLSGMTYSVRDEVAFGPANLGRPRDRILESADRWMRRLGIVHLADRDPLTLSGGELQRTVLAGLMAMEPEVLLLDEPTAELDTDIANRLLDSLAEVAAETIVVIATTDQDAAADRAARVIVLDGGCVISDDDPVAALGSPAVAGADASTTIGRVFHRARPHRPVPVTVAAAVDAVCP